MLKFAPLLLLLTGSVLAGGGRAPMPTVQNPKIDVQDDRKAGQIRVLVRSNTGRVLWQTQIEGQLGGRSDQQSWGVLNGTLWISVLRGVQNWHSDNLGYRLNDGKKLWDMGNVNLPLVWAGGELLLEQLGPEAYPDLHKKNLYIVQASTGVSRWLVLTIPDRPDCGDLNDYSFDSAESLRTWANTKFYYATHKDRCGLFTARFNWHDADNQKPLLTDTQPVVKVGELSFQFLDLQLDGRPRMLAQATRGTEILWQQQVLGRLDPSAENVTWGWEQDGGHVWIQTSDHRYLINASTGTIWEEKTLKGP